MTQIDPVLLLFLKFFVVLTCFFFWIRLAYIYLMRGYRKRRHHRYDEMEE